MYERALRDAKALVRRVRELAPSRVRAQMVQGDQC